MVDIVFRVVHSNGLGPYRNNYEFQVLYFESGAREIHGTSRGRPIFSEDHLEDGSPTVSHDQFLSTQDYDWAFGFSKAIQLVKWFPRRMRNDLATKGYDIKIYKCGPNGIMKAVHQTIFNQKEAILIGQIPLAGLNLKNLSQKFQEYIHSSGS